MKALIVAAVLTLPLPAMAQGWEVYTYPQDGFAVQFPAKPTISKGTYTTSGGVTVPSVVYGLKQSDVTYSMIVADFGQRQRDPEETIAAASKALADQGSVQIDVEARIDRQYGRSLSRFDNDGGRSYISVFFFGGKLYELVGKALPPRPELASSKILRFQQSLDFLDAEAVANRPENRAEGAGPGPGGPGGRRPPPQAFADCRGKAVGEAVRHTIPAGVTVAATCVRTPTGLAARPNTPPPGGPRAGRLPQG